MQAKKERKDKERKEKSRKGKFRGGGNRKSKERHRIDETDSDGSDSYSLETKKSRDRSQKHKKRHLGSFDDTSLDDDEKERPRSHRYSADSKKSKQVALFKLLCMLRMATSSFM